MTWTNLVDYLDCGSFIIDNLLAIPCDSVETTADVATNCNFSNDSFPTIWPTQSESIPCSDSVFSCTGANSDLSAEISVPCEGIKQLEWLSNFHEDSFSSGTLTIDNSIKDPSQNQVQASRSPISVLETSSSYSINKTISSRHETLVPEKRARTKRPRPRPSIQLIYPTSITEATTTEAFPASKASFNSDNLVESIPKQDSMEQKRKNKMKLLVPRSPSQISPSQPTQAVRRCMHCEITKTPQWRAGPMGPKTLCNACGIRYKSGRLFPEYRPAVSPTFVPSLHSSSHKKVLEMRGKGACENNTLIALRSGLNQV